jgi:DNA-3-methyladenine glycosylase
VESEAYHQSEPACHAYVGVTPRTRILFGPPGTAYVYRSYGIHALFNAVCDAEGVGAAVLIRALEPVRGIDLMRERRGLTRLEQLCSGLGKLTQALGIELEHNGTDLVAGPIAIGPRPPGWEDVEVVSGPRIGITKAAELPWRFCALGSRSVSRPWPPEATALLRPQRGLSARQGCGAVPPDASVAAGSAGPGSVGAGSAGVAGACVVSAGPGSSVGAGACVSGAAGAVVLGAVVCGVDGAAVGAGAGAGAVLVGAGAGAGVGSTSGSSSWPYPSVIACSTKSLKISAG